LPLLLLPWDSLLSHSQECHPFYPSSLSHDLVVSPIKANKLQTKTINGKPENAGKNIVADAKLIKIFNNTKITSKTGKTTDFTKLIEGQTIDMMQMASVVSANIE